MKKYKGNLKFWSLVAILLEPEIKKINIVPPHKHKEKTHDKKIH